ncbi:hypothetical protein [Piscinibacter defluvii]|uniref:hypothetical protein n=1 Tax=Piscinibacter defluvii TaxID=1796922 RepID=UPI000FDEC9D6|nr:hypothetical protein [Piscinibacter defluvii]
MIDIIGDAVSIRSDGQTLEEGYRLADEKRSFLCPSTQEYVHRLFAPRMLRYSESIRQALLDSHSTGKFLRETFLYSDSPTPGRGTLYDPASLDLSVRTIGEQQSTAAVKCTWLQNHAFFWLFGRDNPEPMALRFDSQSNALRPEPSWREQFNAKTRFLNPPFKSIASLNYFEQYLRITFSESDQYGESVRIKIPYTAKYDPSHDSRGLLFEITQELAAKRLALRSISMSTDSRTRGAKHGTFRLVASVHDQIPGFESPSKKQEYAKAAAEVANSRARIELSKASCFIEEERPTVTTFGAKTLFLSTSFEWLKTKRPQILKAIQTTAADHGFILVVGDRTLLPKEHEHVWNAADTLTANVLSLLRNSDAFLQLIPRGTIDSPKDPTGLVWLLFESGAAHALRLPCAICLDQSGGIDLQDWTRRLKAGTEKQVYPFAGDMGDDQILEVVDGALRALATQARPGRASKYFGA